MFEMILSDTVPGPLYMRLYGYIKRLIEEGTLRNGTKLPSVRTLQQQLRVSKTTIESAYQLLLAEGYVFSKPKSGYYVVQPQAGYPVPQQEPIASSIQRKRLLLSPEISTTNNPIVDFNLLHVDKDTFPAKAWRSALTEAVDRYSDSLHEYGDPRGEYELRHAIAGYLTTSRGVRCRPHQIVIGSGISYSLFLLKRLTASIQNVAIEQTSIAQIGAIFEQIGFRLIPTPLIEGAGDPRELGSQAVQAAYVTPSHRPSGRPFTNEMKGRLLQWAAANEAYVIEDDYDGEFRYRGKPVPALQGADTQDVVIYLGTFSKVFTPALRMNYMILPERLLAKLGSMLNILSCPSRIDQLAMSVFMERGHWYRHIKRIRAKYRNKREALVKLIEEQMAPFVQVKDSGAGLHIEILVRTNLDADCLIELALREGVRVYGPQYSGMQSREDGVPLYLGFGGNSIEEMQRGVMLLRKAWKEVFLAP